MTEHKESTRDATPAQTTTLDELEELEVQIAIQRFANHYHVSFGKAASLIHHRLINQIRDSYIVV